MSVRRPRVASRLAVAVAVSVGGVTAMSAPVTAATKVTITSAPPAFSASTTATIRWTKSPTRLAVTCRIDAKPFVACAGTSKTFRKLSQGAHTFQLRFRRSGKTVTVTKRWSVDTRKPSGGSLGVSLQQFGAETAFVASINKGTDAGSGIKTWSLRRRTATLAAGVCGRFGAATNDGPAKPDSTVFIENLPANGCVRHELVVTDKAGNSTTYVDTFNGQILRDSTPPVVTLDTITDTNGGSFTVSGSVSDPQSGVRSVRVTADTVADDPANGSTLCTVNDPSATWSCDVNVQDGTWVVAAVATNGANGTGIDLQEGVEVRGDEAGIEIFCVLCSAARTAVEGRHALQLRVVLVSPPFDDVTVGFAPDADISVSPSTLTFGPDDWDVEQTITVTAVDDSTVESDEAKTLSAVAESADAGYDGATGSTTYTILDNDSSRVFLVQTTATGTVRESGLTATRSVSLGKAPTSNVTVTFASDKGGLTFTPSTMTFTPSNFATPQAVTIGATDDDVVEGTITHAVTATAASSDSSYQGLVSSATTITENVDNDSVRLTMDFVTNLIAEGGPARTIDVRLGSRPSANVSVAFTVSGTGCSNDLQLSTSSMTFTPDNAKATQVLTVTAVDDAVDEGLGESCVVTGTATTTDPQYSGLTNSVSYFVDDND